MFIQCLPYTKNEMLELAMCYSGRLATADLLCLLDSSSEVCKGLTKC